MALGTFVLLKEQDLPPSQAVGFCPGAPASRHSAVRSGVHGHQGTRGRGSAKWPACLGSERMGGEVAGGGGVCPGRASEPEPSRREKDQPRQLWRLGPRGKSIPAPLACHWRERPWPFGGKPFLSPGCVCVLLTPGWTPAPRGCPVSPLWQLAHERFSTWTAL